MDCRANGRVWVLAILALLAIVASCPGQSAGGAKGYQAVISQTASFGLLVPDGTGTSATATVPFRLTIPKNTATVGYGLNAIVSFTFTPAARDAGGQSITASDIGIGVASVYAAAGPLPAVVVAPGFEKDPSTVRGKASAGGAASGQATLADLLSGRQILRIGKSSVSSIPAGGSDLQVTLKIAVPSKYFTPGSFSGNLTMTVVP